jgi:hypothetical protein
MEQLISAIAAVADKIIAAIPPIGYVIEHPCVYSMLEMLETMFTGVDENLRERIVPAFFTLSPQMSDLT